MAIMPTRLQREIEKIKKLLLSLCGEVEEAVRLAVRAIERRDVELARRVIDGDEEIDMAEVDLEEECLKIFALHQPVAVDLRFLVAALKINNDLERIGDLATHLAERAINLEQYPEVAIHPELLEMAERAQGMLGRGLNALVNMDAQAAMEVCAADDAVDELHRATYHRIKESIRQDLTAIEPMLQLLSASRYLERIADQATNIAEDVIYLIQGDIIRHRIAAHRRRPPEPPPDLLS
jgi:phosphate transport system protein